MLLLVDSMREHAYTKPLQSNPRWGTGGIPGMQSDDAWGVLCGAAARIARATTCS